MNTVFARLGVPSADGEYPWREVVPVENGGWRPGRACGTAREVNGTTVPVKAVMILTDSRPGVSWFQYNGVSAASGEVTDGSA